MDDITRLIAEAHRQCWGVERRRSGHFMLTPPARAAHTAGSHRRVNSALVRTRRGGPNGQ